MGMLWESGFIEETKSNGKFLHSDFRKLWDYTIAIDGPGKDSCIYESGTPLYLCDDLTALLKKTEGRKVDACKEIFESEKRNFPALTLDTPPAPNVWFNTTTGGIYLRPGKMEGMTKLPPPILMGGNTPHGIIAGRTGSGKSVFLHNILVNLLLEYAPWELELYLADFKLVEMSKYVNRSGYETPHVRACAATSEVEYVLSLIQHIKGKNDDREKLFQRMGYQNIEDFRRDPANRDVLMPRVLFIADEFQQLFLDANNRQKNLIDDMITHLARKGRSQGVHLLFASQDMSGALTQKQMNNFKIRVALQCDEGVSIDILGNKGAADIKVGEVVINTVSSLEKDNQIYKVPFVAGDDAQDGEESYFYDVLGQLASYASGYGFNYREMQKFYQEDAQCPFEDFLDFLQCPDVKKIRRKIPSSAFASIVFGRKTVHSKQRYDIENYFLEYGKNRNLLCLSGINEDLAYVQKHLAANFRSLQAEEEDVLYLDGCWKYNNNLYYDFNPVVSSLYPEKERMEDLGIARENILFKIDDLNFANEIFTERREILSILRSSACRNAREYLLLLWNYYVNEGENVPAEALEKTFADFRVHLCPSLAEDDSNLYEYIRNLYNCEDEYDFLFEPFHLKVLLMIYYRYRRLDDTGLPASRIFDASIIWFSGIDNIERLPRWFSDFAAYCMDYNIYCLFFASSPVEFEVGASCTYIIVGGQDVSLYDKYYGESVKTKDGSISLHCFIKNRNMRFGFKKYRHVFRTNSVNYFDFDTVLNM